MLKYKIDLTDLDLFFQDIIEFLVNGLIIQAHFLQRITVMAGEFLSLCSFYFQKVLVFRC